MRNACLLVLAIGAAVVAACSDGADQQSLTGLRHGNGTGAATDQDSSEATPASNDPAGSDGDETTGDIDAGDGSATNASTTPKDAGADGAAKNNCIDGVASPGSGKHHAGEDCLNCHATQSKRWTVAGTLYSAATGGTAVAGATIEVIDANGKVVKLTTYSNGNFYTTTTVAAPLKVRATKCPVSLPMAGAVTDGSCNGCHDSAMRVHL